MSVFGLSKVELLQRFMSHIVQNKGLTGGYEMNDYIAFTRYVHSEHHMQREDFCFIGVTLYDQVTRLAVSFALFSFIGR